MTQALFTSMTGMNAGTDQLTVVSDNVANMNTEGYSKQKVNLATRNIAGAIGGLIAVIAFIIIIGLLIARAENSLKKDYILSGRK